jgi:hypothetical protein
MPHGLSAEHALPVQRFSIVSKHPSTGGGVEQLGVQNSFGRGQPWVSEQATPVHRFSIVSKQPPVGGGAGQSGSQNSFGCAHGLSGAQSTPVHRPLIVSKHCPLTAQAPSCALQTPASSRWQSFG